MNDVGETKFLYAFVALTYNCVHVVCGLTVELCLSEEVEDKDEGEEDGKKSKKDRDRRKKKEKEEKKDEKKKKPASSQVHTIL